MAKTVNLTAVEKLSTYNEHTNLIVEQEGELNRVAIADLKISSSEIYKQDEEPIDAPEGALWIDTDEESGSSGSGGGSMPVFKIKQNGEWINIAGGGSGGEIPDNLVYVSEENQESAVAPLDADTLGGYTVNSLIDKIYPVGSIYMSVNAVSPATLFGGTWEALKDRFLIGAGEYTTAGSTGGEATHTLTVDEMPSHTHIPEIDSAAGVAPQFKLNNDWDSDTIYPALDISGNAHSYGVDLSSVGGSQPHNNIPPYLSVYMWKRTA